jgi:hypothetical protein
METNYYKELSFYLRQHDLKKANHVVLNELARLIVEDRASFIYMLQNADVPVTVDSDDLELINEFLSGIHSNKKLRLGASMLISHHNKVDCFDGEKEHSEDGLRATSKILYNYFDSDYYDYSNEEGNEQTSNIAGVGQAIAGAVGGVATLGSGIIENQRAKKQGAMDLFKKKQESKDQMVQSIMAQRQAQLNATKTKSEQSQKTIRTALIVGGSVVLIGIGIAVFYMIKKKK